LQEELVDLANAVGSQLGRAHRLSLGDYAKRCKSAEKGFDLNLATHFRMNFGDIVDAATKLHMELVTAYYNFVKK